MIIETRMIVTEKLIHMNENKGPKNNMETENENYRYNDVVNENNTKVVTLKLTGKNLQMA